MLILGEMLVIVSFIFMSVYLFLFRLWKILFIFLFNVLGLILLEVIIVDEDFVVNDYKSNVYVCFV